MAITLARRDMSRELSRGLQKYVPLMSEANMRNHQSPVIDPYLTPKSVSVMLLTWKVLTISVNSG